MLEKMMEKVLENMNRLKGVHHSCIYHESNGIFSTFPEAKGDILSTARRVEQVFSSLQSIDKAHDEIYFSVEDKYLAAYLMYDSHIALLLTDKKINFSLIHMGIRAASAKIRAHLSLNANKQTHVEIKPAIEDSGDPTLDYAFEQILTELINYFGPAAKFVLEDAVIQWETKYLKSYDNIPELSEILAEQFDTVIEKRTFKQFINKLLKELLKKEKRKFNL